MATFAPSPYPIVRQGLALIIPVAGPGQTAVLRPQCIKCGVPADGKPVERTYYWHHPALYLLFLVSPLIYVIVALVVRKGMRVKVSLCMLHAQKRSIWVTLAWVLPVVGIADAFILPQLNVDGGIVALITVVLILAGLVIWAVVGSPIRPKSIDQYRGVFTGFCENFLQEFQETVAEAPAEPPQVPPPPPDENRVIG
jgi:hypothetical protein